jgi:hypothetical protein
MARKKKIAEHLNYGVIRTDCELHESPLVFLKLKERLLEKFIPKHQNLLFKVEQHRSGFFKRQLKLVF